MHPDDDTIAALATAARSTGEAPVVVIERAVSAGAFADPVHGPGLLRAALLEPADRRRGSVHTPVEVARRLVGIAVEAHAAAVADRTGAEPAWHDVRVLDPAVGGGVFAIAAAEALAARGVAPAQAARCVRGVDVDPAAVAATRAGLAAWAGVAAASLDGIRCGDALADADPEPVDLVVGNPPFQSQLAAATARSTDEAERLRLRLGDAVVRYVDTAAVFLVDAVARLRPDGVAALVAPLSILSAGDA
ncbi:MAG: N-6 DNA methylase, partial [Acidimicrobiales bacterium]|nr:N-6 DNA methylase [Acidimicrobiales bacterium]